MVPDPSGNSSLIRTISAESPTLEVRCFLSLQRTSGKIPEQYPGGLGDRVLCGPFLPRFVNEVRQLLPVCMGELQEDLFDKQVIPGYQFIPPFFSLLVVLGLSVDSLFYTPEVVLNGRGIVFPHQRADILHLPVPRAVFFERFGQGDGIEQVHRQINVLELFGRQCHQLLSHCLQRQGFFFLLRFA
jgi:hypothetical protein